MSTVEPGPPAVTEPATAAPVAAERVAALLAALRARLPAGSLATDPAECAFFGHDILGPLAMPAAVARPADVEQLVACVRACVATGVPLTVRGGGASYTHAFPTAVAGALALDTGALRGLAIDRARRTVRLEPGVTWAELDAAAAAEGLRAPFWGPYSGLQATVVGSLSQHAVSLGSGLHETSATTVLALEVVDGTGRVLRTNRPAGAFLRAWGPDLTGLFLGDCGALGVKTGVTLKLQRRPTHVAACSFECADAHALLAALDAVAAHAIASEILGLDPEILKGFLGSLTPRRFAATARAIWSSTPGVASGLAALARAAGSLRVPPAGAWLAHFTVEGWSDAEVRAKAATVRALVRASAGRGVREVSNAAPLALRGRPFLPLAPILAPDGCRWLPTHGLFSFADLPRFHAAFEAWHAGHAAALQAHGVRLTRMLMPVGSTACVYEPTFYWPDARHVVHERLAPPEHLARVPVLPASERTRVLVFALRRELTDLMQAHGAQHLQLGKWYPYRSVLHPGTRGLLDELKAALDPQSLLNPGALELPGPTPGAAARDAATAADPRIG